MSLPGVLGWSRYSPRTGGGVRYGENPHQQAELLQSVDGTEGPDLTIADTGTGAEPIEQDRMSANNYVDASAALELCGELSRECGTGFQPVQSGTAHPGFQPLDDERHTRRNLPHIQTPGKTYFVTFRLRQQDRLSPAERSIVLEACRFWDGSKLDLHACVVMPDHVHLLFTPRETKRGQWCRSGEILHSHQAAYGPGDQQTPRARGTTVARRVL